MVTDPRILTARCSGAVGANALVPRLAREHLPEGGCVLDFGCGPSAIHVEQLRSEGYDAHGHDLAFNAWTHAMLFRLLAEGKHSWSMLLDYLQREQPFDLVYASNVVNVQETESDLFWTCQRIRLAAGWGSVGTRPRNPCPILLNYPQDPRKMGWKMKKMKQYLTEVCFGAEPRNLGGGAMMFDPPARMTRA